MRRGSMLTDLEKKILLYLLEGVTTDRELYKKFFYKANQKHKTRLEVKRRKLINMKKKGYIDYKHYKTHESCIVVITERGVDKIAENMNFLDIDSAWTHLPREGHVQHDLLVAKSARKLYRENEHITIYFEPFLRREFALTGKKRREVYFPDFRLSFIKDNEYSEEKSFNFEIVAGGITRKAFLGKIRSSTHHILFITKRAETAVFLYNYAMKLSRAGVINDQKIERIHFTFAEEFFEYNSATYEWLTPPYQKRLRMDQF
jgi:hypothetical protein